MKYELIKKSPKMIIAFLGYSFLPKSLAHLELGEYGLGVVYEYSELSFDKLEFSKLLGEQNYLFAFSMGVAVANRFCADFSFKKAVAMNGSNAGIDAQKGISSTKFKASIDSFDFEGFKRLCFLGELKKVNFAFNAKAKAELEMLYSYFSSEKKLGSPRIWDKMILSKKDKVFANGAVLAENEFKNLESINAPHFGLFYYKTWEQIFEI